MSKQRLITTKKKKKPVKKKSECPYDDWACRVYGYCGTKKCMKRQEKLKKQGEGEEE